MTDKSKEGALQEKWLHTFGQLIFLKNILLIGSVIMGSSLEAQNTLALENSCNKGRKKPSVCLLEMEVTCKMSINL